MTLLAMPQAILAMRGRDRLPARPFNLGTMGRFLNACAPILVLFSTIINSFPSVLPVTTTSMSMDFLTSTGTTLRMHADYLSVIVLGCWALIVAFYFIAKKGVYHGPVSPSDTRSGLSNTNCQQILLSSQER